jgi:hypothetical protein
VAAWWQLGLEAALTGIDLEPSFPEEPDQGEPELPGELYGEVARCLNRAEGGYTS